MLTDAFALTSDLSLRSAIDRAYYAMYHAALAVLAVLRIAEPRSHTGLHMVFGRELILTGQIDRAFGRDLSYAHQMRLEGTYDATMDITVEEVRDLASRAQRFVAKMTEFVESKMK